MYVYILYYRPVPDDGVRVLVVVVLGRRRQVVLPPHFVHIYLSADFFSPHAALFLLDQRTNTTGQRTERLLNLPTTHTQTADVCSARSPRILSAMKLRRMSGAD